MEITNAHTTLAGRVNLVIRPAKICLRLSASSPPPSVSMASYDLSDVHIWEYLDQALECYIGAA
jgi:hypothetical protein